MLETKKKSKRQKAQHTYTFTHTLKLLFFTLENVVSVIEGCKKAKNILKHPTRLVIPEWVSLIIHVMSSNGDAIKQMLSDFCATIQQQNYANQTTVLF